MCYYYQHSYTCTHHTKVLAKFCTTGGYKQTPCGKVQVWQAIRMGEDCHECQYLSGSSGYEGSTDIAMPVVAGKGQRGVRNAGDG